MKADQERLKTEKNNILLKTERMKTESSRLSAL
jgi:hypothetical protein